MFDIDKEFPRDTTSLTQIYERSKLARTYHNCSFLFGPEFENSV